LQQACASHDPAAARQALLNWAQALWPQRRPATLNEVAGLGGAALTEEIANLNRAMYGSGAKDWRGDGLWAAAEAADGAMIKKAGGKETALEPLYR
jgi:hypothetical protein